MNLYSLRSGHTPGTYFITKFDKYFNVEANYLMTADECACPSGHRPTCRHRKMLHLFKIGKHIGDGWFLNYDTRQWVPPVNDDIDRSAHSQSVSSAPATEEPKAESLPPATVAPAKAERPSSPVAGAPSHFLALRGFQ